MFAASEQRNAHSGLIRVLCAPDSFKGSLAAMAVARSIATGVRMADDRIECDECTIGDGGEGTLAALAAGMNLELRSASVAGPLGSIVEAHYGVSRDGTLAIIELAQASGLMLVRETQRNPMRTTTFGTGQLIRCAIETGCREIIIAIGGSATVDGGCGIAQALGARFFDHDGREIAEHMCGGLLARVARIDTSRLPAVALRVACDVTNPLLGANGAAAVYGPQKGATPAMVGELESGLANLARVCGVKPSAPGTGAAGGAGYGLMALCHATLERGVDLVLDNLRFADRCRGASLVLTGEGRLDAQSLAGKACMGVASAAARLGVPTIAIVGSTGPGWEKCVGSIEHGLLREAISLSARFGSGRSRREPAQLITHIARDIIKSMNLT